MRIRTCFEVLFIQICLFRIIEACFGVRDNVEILFIDKKLLIILFSCCGSDLVSGWNALEMEEKGTGNTGYLPSCREDNRLVIKYVVTVSFVNVVRPCRNSRMIVICKKCLLHLFSCIFIYILYENHFFSSCCFYNSL